MGAGTLGLETALSISAAARARGRQLDLQPLTVVVLDAGGHVIALEREDGSGFMRPAIASGKAWGALGIGSGSRELARRAETSPSFIGAIASLAEGGLVPVPGGVLIRHGLRGPILGAVGISGDLSDRDEDCAVAGIRSCGLEPDTGA